MQHQNRPVLIKQLFTAENHQKIIQYLDEFAPYLPFADDHKQPQKIDFFKRRFYHNLPFFVEIHKQLVDFASDIFDEKLKPSYSFLSLYEDGGRCPLHVDRPQCKYTIDYLIRQESDQSWPLKIAKAMPELVRQNPEFKNPETDEEINCVIQTNKWFDFKLMPNDAVCYSGTNAWHYRPTTSVGTTDLVFFHFVTEGFDGPLN